MNLLTAFNLSPIPTEESLWHDRTFPRGDRGAGHIHLGDPGRLETVADLESLIREHRRPRRSSYARGFAKAVLFIGAALVMAVIVTAIVAIDRLTGGRHV